jgi:hypothetical protein
METGFEDVKVTVYDSEEQELSHFKLKLPDYLVKLVDQRDHIEYYHT